MSPPPKPEPRDFRQEVTDRIIALLEEGVAPWQKPWEAAKVPMPVSVATGKPYRGGNALQLYITSLERGYSNPRWMTYKQAADHGWQVRKGENGTPIEFWDFKSEEATTDASEEGNDQQNGKKNEGLRQRRVIHRVYTVFNGQQIDGIPPLPARPLRTPIEMIESGERILAHSGARIQHDKADRAFYRLATDSIHLPQRDHFADAAGYYGTALHELAHWTGHPSRLGRLTLSGASHFGDPGYAREELRAELASLFIAAEHGIPHDPRQNAAYVASWIKALKDDKHEIFRAAHDAAAAADYILNLERSRDDTPEAETNVNRVQQTARGSRRH